eukprot:TRINITY_DN1019_c0_g1_i1.p1 TRINITY_DN1019_c0_g1~~TRINITY_DN1019_c0_g1_i1.p1  ORF type:complete len:220 (-),score=10.91 TRINITY_DN1019_c0_g1_i1:301-960(-)
MSGAPNRRRRKENATTKRRCVIARHRGNTARSCDTCRRAHRQCHAEVDGNACVACEIRGLGDSCSYTTAVSTMSTARADTLRDTATNSSKRRRRRSGINRGDGDSGNPDSLSIGGVNNAANGDKERATAPTVETLVEPPTATLYGEESAIKRLVPTDRRMQVVLPAAACATDGCRHSRRVSTRMCFAIGRVQRSVCRVHRLSNNRHGAGAAAERFCAIK